MGTLTTTLVIIMGFLLVLLLFILLYPFTYRFTLRYCESYSAIGSAGFGRLIQLLYSAEPTQKAASLRVAGISLPARKGDTNQVEKKKSQRKKRKASSPDRSKAFSLLTDRDFMHQAFQLGRDFVQIIKPETFRIEGRIGFNDPYYTGWLMASMAALHGFALQETICLDPVWDEACMDLEMEVAGSFPLILLVIRMLQFLLHRSVRRKLKLLRPASVR